MTEPEWRACTDPAAMLQFLHGKTSDRKLRLLAAACCRRLWHLMGERTAPGEVDAAEAFADGAVGEWKVRHIRSELQPRIRHWGAWAAGQALVDLLDLHAGIAARGSFQQILSFRFVFASEGLRTSAAYQAAAERDAERDRLVGLHRCLFGNPFRLVAASPSWLTSVVAGLARQMYDSREFSPMPILADALQDAGCEDEDILAHCRGDGPHVRGCWVVDLILGKE